MCSTHCNVNIVSSDFDMICHAATWTLDDSTNPTCLINSQFIVNFTFYYFVIVTQIVCSI